MSEYTLIHADRVPTGLRWDTPPEHAGQIVVVSYAATPPTVSPACDGARYRRVTDRSVGPEAHVYYMRVSS